MKQHEDKFDETMYERRRHGSAWISAEVLDSMASCEVLEEQENEKDSDVNEYKIAIYRDVHKKLGMPINETLYYRSKNNRYFEIDDVISLEE